MTFPFPLHPEDPPVCVCDEPDTRPSCERCLHRGEPAMCHSCHMPYGPVFAEVREAWRDHLAGRSAA